MIFIIIIVGIILYFILANNSDRQKAYTISNDYKQLNSEQKLLLEFTEIFHKASIDFPPSGIPDNLRGIFEIQAIKASKKSMEDNAAGFSKEFGVTLNRVYDIIEMCYSSALKDFER